MNKKTCNNKAMHWNAKTKNCREYATSDFKIQKYPKYPFPDKRVPFMLMSKDGNVEANFFWQPDNVELRGLYGESGTIHIAYPMANYRGGGLLKDVKEEKILFSLVRRLKDITKYG